MADKVMQIELIPRESQTDEVTENMTIPSSEEALTDIPNFNMPSMGGVMKIASVGVIATAALNLAKKGAERIKNLELEQRSINEALRNYGGAGYSTNSFGDRYDIFGRKIVGESVAYKKEF